MGKSLIIIIVLSAATSKLFVVCLFELREAAVYQTPGLRFPSTVSLHGYTNPTGRYRIITVTETEKQTSSNSSKVS